MKRTFFKAREAGPVELHPWVKRKSVQSFQFFRLHSVEASFNDWTDKAMKKRKNGPVRQDGHAFQFAVEACRHEKDIVLAAVRCSEDAFRYAGQACKNDPDICLAAKITRRNRETMGQLDLSGESS